MKLNAQTFAIVVLLLGLTLLLCIGGAIFLAAEGIDIPDLLKVTASACVAALVGMLVKTPDQQPPAKQ